MSGRLCPSPHAAAPPLLRRRSRAARRPAAVGDGDDFVSYGASARLSANPETALLIATTKRIRALGQAGDAQGAVDALASLGRSGVAPDNVAVTATLARSRRGGAARPG